MRPFVADHFLSTPTFPGVHIPLPVFCYFMNACRSLASAMLVQVPRIKPMPCSLPTFVRSAPDGPGPSPHQVDLRQVTLAPRLGSMRLKSPCLSWVYPLSTVRTSLGGRTKISRTFPPSTWQTHRRRLAFFPHVVSRTSNSFSSQTSAFSSPCLWLTCTLSNRVDRCVFYGPYRVLGTLLTSTRFFHRLVAADFVAVWVVFSGSALIDDSSRSILPPFRAFFPFPGTPIYKIPLLPFLLTRRWCLLPRVLCIFLSPLLLSRPDTFPTYP